MSLEREWDREGGRSSKMYKADPSGTKSPAGKSNVTMAASLLFLAHWHSQIIHWRQSNEQHLHGASLQTRKLQAAATTQQRHLLEYIRVL